MSQAPLNEVQPGSILFQWCYESVLAMDASILHMEHDTQDGWLGMYTPLAICHCQSSPFLFHRFNLYDTGPASATPTLLQLNTFHAICGTVISPSTPLFTLCG
jgi:hypothetical protein